MVTQIRERTDVDFERAPVAVAAYYDVDSFYAEAKRYAEIGFFPSTVTNQPQRAGFIRIVLISFFALLWKPRPILIVTYVKRQP